MRAIIITLLIGTIFAVACASPAPSKLQSLQALLQSVVEEKQAQLMDDDDDNDVDAQVDSECKRAALNLILQKMAKMQESDDDKLADAQFWCKIIKKRCKISWLMILLHGWELTGLLICFEHNNQIL